MKKVKLKRVKPIVHFVGSLLQQNFGETLDGHGWCLWKVPSKTFEFVPLQNEYGYCTLEIIDGKVDLPPNMPDKVRMRLFTGNSDSVEIKRIITELRSKINIVELSINRSRLSKTFDNAANITHHTTLDLTSLSVQNELINKWLRKKYASINPNGFATIQKINTELNNKIRHEDQSRNVHWKPLTFKFSNMFSYGEDNEIDFTDMTGVYGLFAPNASGKSSIMDALMFCLYDKTPRAFKGDHIINNRKDTFDCELIFEINQEKFGIKRTGNRKKNGDVKVDVKFWKMLPNNEVVSLNGEDRRGTNLNIRNYVGTYDDFVMTAFSGQVNNALFIDKSHSERKDLLIQFMGLNVFDKLYEVANGESREITGVLKRFKKNEVIDELETTKNNLNNTKDILSQAELEIETRLLNRGTLEAKINELQDKKLPVPVTSANLLDLENRLQYLLNKLEKNKKELVDINNLYERQYQELTECRVKFSNYDLERLKRSVDEFNKLLDLYKKKEQTLKVVTTQLVEKNKFKDRLNAYKYNLNCSVCVENNKSVIFDLKTVSSEIEKLASSSIILREELEAINLQMDLLIPEKNYYHEGIQLNDRITNIENNVIPKMLADIEVLKMTDGKILGEINTTATEIEIYNSNIEALEFNAQIQLEINNLFHRIENINLDIQAKEKTIRSLHGTVSVLSVKKEDLIRQLKEAEELEVLHEAYSYYMEAIGRDGIPYELISKAIPQIEGEINNILSQLVDFTISLNVDGKNINGKIIYDHDRVWPLENSSGMERFISSLVIRVALMNVSNLPKPNFMMIDEGFATLDVDHIHTMQTLFTVLKAHFDFILIVSHLDAMRDMVDTIIDIKKEEGYSSINI
jgi:DNA repair exonuclease SbcCD ATPase subunit